MEKYFANPESCKYDVLIGNGFTIAYETKDFDYEKFTSRVEAQLGKNGLDEIRENIFFKSVVEDGKEIKNIEEYILRLKKLKDVAFRVLSSKEQEAIESLYNEIYKEFELEFSKNESSASKRDGINSSIEHIFSTNLLPDFNCLLDQDKMPVNFIKEEGGSLYKNPHFSCKSKEECVYCYKENLKCSNSYMYKKYFHKPKILYLHGSSNVWYKEEADGKCEYSFTSRINPNVENLKNKGMSPLFIIDGNGESKEARIAKHDYTKAAFEIFKKSSNDLIVYGNSLSEQDSHLVKVIEKKMELPNFKLYVSIHSDSTNEKDALYDYTSEIARVLEKFSKEARNRIYFIKSTEVESLIFS